MGGQKKNPPCQHMNSLSATHWSRTWNQANDANNISHGWSEEEQPPRQDLNSSSGIRRRGHGTVSRNTLPPPTNLWFTLHSPIPQKITLLLKNYHILQVPQWCFWLVAVLQLQWFILWHPYYNGTSFGTVGTSFGTTSFGALASSSVTVTVDSGTPITRAPVVVP